MPDIAIDLHEFHAGQQRIWDSRSKYTVIRCGRRFGKTTMFEDGAAAFALNGDKVGWFAPDYKIMLPSYKRTLQALRPVVANASKVDGLIELITGGSIEFWTLNNEDAGRSRNYDEVFIDEGSLVQKGLKEIWEQAIKPTLLDRNGNAWMAGTPKGIDPDNYFYVACTDPNSPWKEFHAPTRDNPTLNPVAVARLEQENDPLVYRQEFLAEFIDWRGHAFFSEASMLEGGQPVEPQKSPMAVFAVMDTAVKSGKEHDGTAITYWSYSPMHGHPLTLLDWDIVSIEGSLLEAYLPSVYQRLEAFASSLHAVRGSIGLFIEDKASGTILLQQAIRRDLLATAIDSKLTAVGKDERALSVSGYVYQGKVKISRDAYVKTVKYHGQTRNHFIHQVCGYRVGQKDGEDDLLDTFCYAIAITLGNDEGY